MLNPLQINAGVLQFLAAPSHQTCIKEIGKLAIMITQNHAKCEITSHMKSNLLHQRLLFAAASRGRGECRDRLVTAGVLPPLLCAGFKCNFKINGAHPSAKRLPWLGTMITSNQPTVLRIVSQFLHRYFRKIFPTSFNKDFPHRGLKQCLDKHPSWQQM